MHHKFIVLLISLFLANNNYGQAAYGKLTVKVKSDKEYGKFWDTVYLKSKDTILQFALDYKKKKNSYMVPFGQYTVTLKSRFTDRVSKTVKLKKKAKMKFNTATYYLAYTDTNSLLDLINPGDTGFIYCLSGTSWAQEPAFFMVVREEGKYRIIIKNEFNDLIRADVFSNEIPELRLFGKYIQSDETAAISGLGSYYWAFKGKILKGACGTCLYGFLLRKRLVKMP